MRIDQETALGPRWVQLSRLLAVFPRADLPIFAERVNEEWTMESGDEIPALRFEGQLAAALPNRFAVNYAPLEPVSALGYRALRSSFHRGASI